MLFSVNRSWNIEYKKLGYPKELGYLLEHFLKMGYFPGYSKQIWIFFRISQKCQGIFGDFPEELCYFYWDILDKLDIFLDIPEKLGHPLKKLDTFQDIPRNLGYFSEYPKKLGIFLGYPRKTRIFIRISKKIGYFVEISHQKRDIKIFVYFFEYTTFITLWFIHYVYESQGIKVLTSEQPRLHLQCMILSRVILECQCKFHKIIKHI